MGLNESPYKVKVEAVVELTERRLPLAVNQAKNSVESLGMHDQHLDDVNVLNVEPYNGDEDE